MKYLIAMSMISTMCFFESTVGACVSVGKNNTYTVDAYGAKKTSEKKDKKFEAKRDKMQCKADLH